MYIEKKEEEEKKTNPIESTKSFFACSSRYQMPHSIPTKQNNNNNNNVLIIFCLSVTVHVLKVVHI
jgi:hypothetical protein